MDLERLRYRIAEATAWRDAAQVRLDVAAKGLEPLTAEESDRLSRSVEVLTSHIVSMQAKLEAPAP